MADFSFKGLNLTSEGKQFVKELNKLTSLTIKCGFPEGENAYDDGTDLVSVAIYNEYGTSNMPARPFMKQSWEEHEDDLKKVCQEANQIIVNGGTAQEAASTIGAFGVGLIQQQIVDGDFVPNAESTIRQKGSERPLIDTGHMRQSVKYVIEKE
jgi:hypothetical protein